MDTVEHPVSVTTAEVKQQPDEDTNGIVTSLTATAEAATATATTAIEAATADTAIEVVTDTAAIGPDTTATATANGTGVTTAAAASATVNTTCFATIMAATEPVPATNAPGVEGRGCVDGITTSKTLTSPLPANATAATAAVMLRTVRVDLDVLSCDTVSAISATGVETADFLDGVLSSDVVPVPTTSVTVDGQGCVDFSLLPCKTLSVSATSATGPVGQKGLSGGVLPSGTVPVSAATTTAAAMVLGTGCVDDLLLSESVSLDRKGIGTAPGHCLNSPEVTTVPTPPPTTQEITTPLTITPTTATPTPTGERSGMDTAADGSITCDSGGVCGSECGLECVCGSVSVCDVKCVCDGVSAVGKQHVHTHTSLCTAVDGCCLPDLLNASTALLPVNTETGTAMEAERALSVALRSLQQEMRERGHTPSHDDLETVTTMKEQVDRLSQREQELERRLQCVCDENSELKENISSLHTQLTLQKQHSQQHAQEVAESRREVSVARERVQYLQQQIEALEEEVSLHDSRHSNASLLSELELSLDTIGLDREQVSKDVMLILRLLLPLAQGSQELTITHSLTHTQNQEHPETHKQTHTEPEEVDTLSDTHTHPDTQSDIHTHSDTLSDTHTHSEEMEVGQGDLQSMMGQLKDLAEELAQQYTSQVSGSVAGVGTGECESSAQIQELTEQVCVLREENGVLRVQSERSRVQEEQLQQAIKDRDDAIAKKTLMEVELVRCKNDMMSLNNQLLEAIQRKLQLSQELEAWQDDIQVILNQQLRTQHQWEQSQRKPAVGEGGAGWGGNTLSFLRRPSRRMSTAPPPCPVVAPIPTVSAPLSAPSPWTDWFKRGK
ncbi:pneumococcal serine-rich repeat protein isoform X2 [Engraulis encrasicolus]|uniref:pneumococcal serine-rich repeat protein isoform X2 n=1 Tax=Engraulis encrasicolus TaxID=184585 RepID=UPI002FD438A4